MSKHVNIIAALSQMPDIFHVWDGELGPKVMTQPWGRATQLTWSQAEAFTAHALAPIPRKGPGREMGRRSEQMRKAQ